MTASGAARIERAVRAADEEGRTGLVGFVTGGFPSRAAFAGVLEAVAGICDVVEVGVPFSDPMADGVTIQRASEVALRDGTTLEWLIEAVGPVAERVPVVFMSYLNPVLQYGLEEFARDAGAAGVAGLIVPDLPFEECLPVRGPLDDAGMALIQLVTPATPQERMVRLCGESRGFVYAVTMLGTTGASVAGGDSDDVSQYMRRVRAASTVPAMAGFGIRTPDDVRRIAPHADGVIVGSAVIEAIERGDDPAQLLSALREAGLRSGASV